MSIRFKQVLCGVVALTLLSSCKNKENVPDLTQDSLQVTITKEAMEPENSNQKMIESEDLNSGDIDMDHFNKNFVYTYAGDVLEDREEQFLYPVSQNIPDHLYAISEGQMTPQEAVMIISLQGLLAKVKPEIYIETGIYGTHLNDLKENYGVSITRKYDVWSLLDLFVDKVDGFIVCDFIASKQQGDHNQTYINPSLNVATSLAGYYNAIIVDKSIINHPKFLAYELKEIMDVSDKDITWLITQPEYQQLNKNLAIELVDSTDYLYKLRDYAIMSNALCFYSKPEDGNVNTRTRQKIMADLNEDCAVIGWGYPHLGEEKFVKPTSLANHFYVPADHAYNLSVLSAFSNLIQKESEVDLTHFKQKVSPKDTAIEAVDGKHYVTFIMSDGDNLQYALNNFDYNGDHYMSSLRGEVSIGWGLPASMPSLSPSVLNRLYDVEKDGTKEGKSGKDQFIMYGGGGYFYPSMYTQDALLLHAKRLAKVMRRADTNILGVIDFDLYTEESKKVWDCFTGQDGIDGIIYVDYNSYATNANKILWSNDKPVIASRARFWADLPNSDIASVAKTINELPTDITNENSYSIIMVHCWSKGVSDIIELTKAFHENVEVVTPSELFHLVSENVKR